MGQESSESSTFDSVANNDARQVFQKRLGSIERRLRRRTRQALNQLRDRTYDVDDVFSSARRRLDEALLIGKLRIPDNDAELESLLHRAARRVASDAMRRNRRQWALYVRVGAMQCIANDHPRDAALQLAIQTLLRQLPGDDSKMLTLWATGMPHTAIADATGVSFEAHRSRWRRLMNKLRITAMADDRHT